jgi:hypothetical protein
MFDSGEGFVPVDWSKITGDIVQQIQTVDEERQKQRGEIQTKTDELLTDLRDYQAGGNNTFNGYVLDGSTQVKDYMLMQNKLLKQGKLDPNSYTRSQQLLQDDWNSFQTAADTFNTDYAAAIEAVNAGDSSKLALLSFDGMQKATDIQNSRLVINTDGRLYSQTEDGTLVGFTNMNARQKDLPKNYNITEGAKKFSATLGQYQKAYPSMTIQDIASQPDFIKARDTFIDGVLNQGTGRDFLSILTQNGFELTQNPNKVNENTILVKHDGNGMLQPDSESLNKHSDKAKEIMRKAINVQLDYKETPGGTVSVSERMSAKTDKEKIKSAGDNYALTAQLFSTNGNLNQSAATKLAQANPNIDRIQLTTDGINVELVSGQAPIPVKFKNDDGSFKTPSDLTNEVFAVFYRGNQSLSGTELEEVQLSYIDNLNESATTAFAGDRYDITELSQNIPGFLFDVRRPKELARFDFEKIKIGGESSANAVNNHNAAVTNITTSESSEVEKRNQIKQANLSMMNLLMPNLKYTDAQTKKQTTLPIEQLTDGAVVYEDDAGKTQTIIDINGQVNTSLLSNIINQKQVDPGTTGVSEGIDTSKYDN